MKKPISLDYKFDDEVTNKYLFEKYYPHLSYENFKDSDLWHQCVLSDLLYSDIYTPSKNNTHSNLVNDNPKLENEELYNDKPGPVG